MPSQRVDCPECGAANRIHGGMSSQRKREGNRRCSNCEEILPCPVCQADEYPDNVVESDTCPAGWFRGESTGDCLACHFCNIEEAQRQKRSRGGGGV